MNRKPLPIGIEDFKKLIQEDYYYIDKTLLIKELLDKKHSVLYLSANELFEEALGGFLMQQKKELEDLLERTIEGFSEQYLGENYA